MSEATIAALLSARKNSQRCKNKMLRPFADTTLVDLALDRLERLEGVSARYYAVHEEELLEKANGRNVTVLRRSYESANDLKDRASQIFDFLANVPDDYIMWINSCNVFLSDATLSRAVKTFLTEGCRSMTAVVTSRNWFYTMDGKPINNPNPKCIGTKFTPPVYEVVHAFHIFNREFLLENDAYWRNQPKDPFLFVIPEEERPDIDTELEFQVAEQIYVARKHLERQTVHR